MTTEVKSDSPNATAIPTQGRRLLDVLQSGAAWMETRGVEHPRLSFEWLAARALGCKRLELYLRFETILTESQLVMLRDGMRRMAAGEPLAYVLGDADFMGRRFVVDRRVLIPRPETEELVGHVLACAPLWQIPAPALADVGTGSGCIALTLAAERPAAVVLAVDLSEAALKVARGNAERLELGARVRFEQRDLLEGLAGASLDGVAANLPYIARGDLAGLPKTVRAYEPESALDGGADGLNLVRRLAGQARTALQPGGWIFLEIGAAQGPMTTECLTALGYVDVEIKPDLAGRARVAIARTPGAAGTAT